MLKNNEVQAVETAAEATVKSGLTKNQKVVGIVVLTVISAGLVALGYGIYRGVTSRKAAKASEGSTPEELHE